MNRIVHTKAISIFSPHEKNGQANYRLFMIASTVHFTKKVVHNMQRKKLGARVKDHVVFLHTTEQGAALECCEEDVYNEGNRIDNK